MKRLFFIALLIMLCSYTGLAQTFSLTGTVTANQKPLTDVSVYVPQTHQHTYTDRDGQYELQLPEGTYEISFFYGNQKKVHIQLQKDTVLDVDLTDIAEKLTDVFVSAYRVDADSPITFSNLDNEELNGRNLGQDIPIMLNYMPSVVTTSDAGAGIGYTGIRVRGSDGARINTTINGVPLNDGESQGVFWVNLGDFTNSVENIQLQRGVGTSTNGAGAFGATLNILTDDIEEEPSLSITNTYGSFNTHKHQLKFNTGLLSKYFSFSGNFGLSQSDGYRDRAFSDLKSYFLQGVYHQNNTLIKAIGFGGAEQTYQAYYGVTKEEMKANRRFNPAGMYTDAAGNTQFYDNQTDNYKQDHFQLLWNQRFNEHWSSNLTFHYTYGRGYYESYHQDADLHKYGLSYFEHNGSLQTTADIVNQKWLDNHFYGTVFNLTYKNQGIKTTFGGAWNRYWGDHYGEVISANALQEQLPLEHYYDNKVDKRDYTLFVKTTFSLTEKLSAFADIQGRFVRYKTYGPYENTEFNLKDNLSFFNPKLGFTYQFDEKDQLYTSYAQAHKEPNRSDYQAAVLGDNPEAGYPKPETLHDFELGWRHHTAGFWFNANLFFMDYRDQLVLTGEIDNEGRTLRQNSGRSYRAGIELESDIRLSPKLNLSPNLTLSQNKNRNYIAAIDGELVNLGKTDLSFSPGIIAGGKIGYTPVRNLKFIWLSKYVGSQYMSNIKSKESELDPFWVNDFNAFYSWENSPLFKRVVFKVLVNNVFDVKYSSNGTYSPDYGASYYPQAGIHFIGGITLDF